jgi:hypothetical protein
MQTSLFLASILLLNGCAHFTSRQTETAPDGTQRVTRVSVTTFLDARSEVAKLRATTSDKTQGLSLGSVSENSSSTNAVEILRHVAAILGAVK